MNSIRNAEIPMVFACALGLMATAVEGQISIKTDANGKSSVSLAGEMSVAEGMEKIFVDIDNNVFSCSVVPSVKTFLAL